ncbi:hypothetical protein DSS99_14260 [Salmonella enterica subsp. enterica serovar Livingstone]|uniref:Uncharacterized protein n=2 Tax=Salmonella enterica I TaxID=59201 RepID=A0A5H9I3T7_SALPT|nr:hypothetical protein CHE40_21725 [Salmonella enterica]EAA1217751.1 hypothetical protein [Salmonella enterica subsp. enterica serovar Paratyphi A]EAA1316210.1 hypothetical protein [Salmonella enterica subsp. enterica serovar Java]EAA1831296.1 hypothetical protein [Salmonella enterica subsp. enterica serovar Napoli]EAA3932468.1 hypothetical protein [Salmonella enterica subsp. enterica serovar Livingstone]EAA6342181.1 hypothetical protein [Salmonella enterica subsp. enterica serovar Veneziana]
MLKKLSDHNASNGQKEGLSAVLLRKKRMITTAIVRPESIVIAVRPEYYMTAANAFATRCTFEALSPATHMRPLAIR